MLNHSVRVSELLESLMPKDEGDLSLLQSIIKCAQVLHRGSVVDIGLGRASMAALDQSHPAELSPEMKQFVEALPEDSKRYFHGLVEAIEIYHSIKGRPLSIQTLALTDSAILELRQIRNLCMEEGPRSIY